jgi:hypothetical protein
VIANSPADDTDTWYLVECDPIVGWQLDTANAQGGTPRPLNSAARAIISGQVLFLVIPVTELGALPAIPARLYTFAHMGGFGLSGDPWSADTVPPVPDRLSISLTAL